MNETALYQLLMGKPYPIHQRMDFESLIWLKENLEVKEDVSIESFLSKYERFPINDIVFDSDLFCNISGLGIHGIRHQFRVAIYVWILFQKIGLPLTSSEIRDLLQVSIYHDIMRENDNSDEKHGINSAYWIRQHFLDIDEKIVKAVEVHNQEVIDDDRTVFISLLKAADALDRYRLPKKKWWVKQEYLDYPIDEKDLMIFKYITYHTERVTLNYDNVETIKKEMLAWLEENRIV